MPCFVLSQISKFEKLLKKSFPKHDFSSTDIHAAFHFVNFIMKERPEERPNAARVKKHLFLQNSFSSFSVELNYSPQRFNHENSSSTQTVEAQNGVPAPTPEVEKVFEAREPLLEDGSECENRVPSSEIQIGNENEIALRESERMCEDPAVPVVDNNAFECYLNESMYAFFPVQFIIIILLILSQEVTRWFSITFLHLCV